MLLDTQPVLRVSVAEPSRFGQPGPGPGLIARDSPAVFVQRRQVELRPAMALLGGLGLALGRLSKVLREYPFLL